MLYSIRCLRSQPNFKYRLNKTCSVYYCYIAIYSYIYLYYSSCSIGIHMIFTKLKKKTIISSILGINTGWIYIVQWCVSCIIHGNEENFTSGRLLSWLTFCSFWTVSSMRGPSMVGYSMELKEQCSWNETFLVCRNHFKNIFLLMYGYDLWILVVLLCKFNF